jgi:hypothetical protein
MGGAMRQVKDGAPDWREAVELRDLISRRYETKIN